LGSPVVIAIALSVADELAFGVDRKFGCNEIAHSSKTDKIAVFGFSHKAIAFQSYSAQVKAITSPSYFDEFSLKLVFLTSRQAIVL
jgi:hypothetical protein